MTVTAHSYIFVDLKHRLIEARLSCSYTKEGEWHFAECPELRLVAQGKSKWQALENLVDMIAASLIEAIESDKIDEMLRELGFRRTELVPLRKVFRRSIEPDDKDVPLSLEVPLGASELSPMTACVG